MKTAILLIATMTISGCASLTNDSNMPIALSLSDGSSGVCRLENKRGVWEVSVPSTCLVRRSDDSLKYYCETDGGKTAVGFIPSTIGAKIIASAVFLDFGIVDAITDKHREYPASFVIPIENKGGVNMPLISNKSKSIQEESEKTKDEMPDGIF